MRTLMAYYSKFEAWFNRSLGWFFTNGMKQAEDQ